MTRSVPCGPCDDIICWLCDPKLCNPLLLSPFNCGLVCVPLWCRTEAWGRAIHAWLSWRWEPHYCVWVRPNTCFCSSEQVEFEEAGTGSSRGGRLGYKWKHFFLNCPPRSFSFGVVNSTQQYRSLFSAPLFHPLPRRLSVYNGQPRTSEDFCSFSAKSLICQSHLPF